MTALVFIVGACSGLVQSIPIISAANAAADRLAQLEVKLAGITSLSDEVPSEPAKKFTKIEVRDVQFHYPGKTADTPFKVGPFNFTLNAGDLRHADRRQWLGQIDLHENPGRLLPAGGRRAAARRHAGGGRALRGLSQPDHRDLPRLPSVPAALRHRRSRSGRARRHAHAIQAAGEDQAHATANSRPPSCRAASAGGWR